MKKEAIYFTKLKNTFIKHPEKKRFSLHCCEPVLLCVFNAQNRVQFTWAKLESDYIFLSVLSKPQRVTKYFT